MARKERNLASFSAVASEDNIVVKEDKNDMIINNDVDVINNDDGEDIFDQLIDGKKKKQVKNVWTGVYLKPEIAKVLEQLSKRGGKGAKSEIVNESLRRVFSKKGLI